MNKILPVLLALSFACKKEDPKPEPKPCQTTTPTLTGRYLLVGSDEQDTVVVVFDRNNCPTEGQNHYKFKNFYKTVRPRMKDSTQFTTQDLDVLVTENSKTGSSTNNPAAISFTLNGAGTPILAVESKKLNTTNLYLVQ